jgi:Mg-chelatase subunit ChlD
MNRARGLALACAVWAAAASAGGAASLTVLTVDASQFPLVRVLHRGDAPAPAQVLENGLVAPTHVVATPAGLTLALVVDTSGSMAPALDRVKAAATRVVQRLEPGDKAALVAFASRVQVLAAPTADRERLTRALAGLRAEGATALYDAIRTGVEQVRGLEGVAAVVLLTDGKDEDAPGGAPASAARLEPVKQFLQGAGVPLYILALGTEVDRQTLNVLAAASHGGVLPADNPEAVDELYQTVIAGLRAVREFRYVSPNGALDGTSRVVTLPLAAAGHSQLTYLAPRDARVVWRFATDGEPGSLCRPAALSAAGHWAFAASPPTLIADAGRVIASAPDPERPHERAGVLDDGLAFGFGGAGGMRYRFVTGSATLAVEDRSGGGAPDADPDGGGPVAVSPGGRYELLHGPGPGGASVLSARDTASGAFLWRAAVCPRDPCDRVAGAAMADTGVALVNQGGVLYRIDAQGRPRAPRREVFFPQVSLSADGKLAAAVTLLPAPKKALLLDETLGAVAEQIVRSHADGIPAVAAVSPNGRYFAVRDDFMVQGMAVAERRWHGMALSRLRPGPDCALTLAIDNGGRILAGDGASLFLLRGFAGGWE